MPANHEDDLFTQAHPSHLDREELNAPQSHTVSRLPTFEDLYVVVDGYVMSASEDEMK